MTGKTSATMVKKGVRTPAFILAGTLLLVTFSIAASGRFEDPKLALDLFWATPSPSHLLGCGEGGIDLLYAVSLGIFRALWLSSLTASIAAALGCVLGALVAMKGGALERVALRAADLVQTLPTFLLAVAVSAVVKNPGTHNLVILFSVTGAASFARLAIAQTQALRGQGFVEAASALGRDRTSSTFRHVIPQLLPVLGVQWGSMASAVLVSEAALGFLGFETSGMSLGTLLGQGAFAMLRAPHVLLVSAASVAITAMSLLLLGAGLSERKS